MSWLPAVKVMAPNASRDTNTPVSPSSAYCMLVSVEIVTAIMDASAMPRRTAGHHLESAQALRYPSGLDHKALRFRGHVAEQPPPLQMQPAQPPVGGGTALATRWPSNPPASRSPTAPAPATATITVSAAPSAPRARAPPAAQTAPAATIVGAATRLAALNAASERSVAAVRMPANRLRGNRCCQPSSPTVSSAEATISSTTASSLGADTAVRIPAGQARG